MEFNERLTIARKAAGYTQTTISEQLMIDRTRYGKWESGKASPSFDMLASICVLLDVSADYLIGLTDDPRRNTIKEPAELAGKGVVSVETTNGDRLTAEEIAAIRAMLQENRI